METLMSSLLGRDEEFVVEKLKSLTNNEEKVKSQEEEMKNAL